MQTETTTETTEMPPIETAPEEKPVGWNDVIAESQSIEAVRRTEEEQTETVRDTLDVPLTDELRALLFRLNVKDDDARKDLEKKLEAQKAAAKAIKAQIDVITERIDERNAAEKDGVYSFAGEWQLTDLFDNNAVRCFETTTGYVYERTMDWDERQTDLPFDRANAPTEPPPAEDEGIAADADAASETDVTAGSDDYSEDDIPTFDDSTNLGEHGPDASSTDVTDPEAVLAGKAKGKTNGGTPPSKPSRRGRKGLAS